MEYNPQEIPKLRMGVHVPRLHSSFVAHAVGLRRNAEMPEAFLDGRKCEDMRLHQLLPSDRLPIFELPCINSGFRKSYMQEMIIGQYEKKTLTK